MEEVVVELENENGEGTETILETNTEVPDRHFLTTALDDYTVSEGLLLLIFIFVFLGFLLKLGREIF